MPIPVHLDVMPFSGQLDAWGRTEAGWWGLVHWEQRVIYTEPREAILRCAAWVPERRLKQPHWSRTTEPPPRLVLPSDNTASWPAPTNWDGWFAGVWEVGPAPLPPNVQPAPPSVLRRSSIGSGNHHSQNGRNR